MSIILPRSFKTGVFENDRNHAFVSLAISENFVFAASAKIVLCWTTRGAYVGKFKGHKKNIVKIFIYDGKLFSICENAVLIVRTVSTQKKLSRHQLNRRETITYFVFGPRLIGSARGEILCYDLRNINQPARGWGFTNADAYAKQIVIANGKLIVVHPIYINIIDVSTKKQTTHLLSDHSDSISHLARMSNDEYILFMSSGKELILNEKNNKMSIRNTSENIVTKSKYNEHFMVKFSRNKQLLHFNLSIKKKQHYRMDTLIEKFGENAIDMQIAGREIYLLFADRVKKITIPSYYHIKLDWPLFSAKDKQKLIFLATLLSALNKNTLAIVLQLVAFSI